MDATGALAPLSLTNTHLRLDADAGDVLQVHDDPQRAQEAVGAVLSKTQQDIASAQLELVEAERVVQKRETEVENRDDTLKCYLSSPTRRAIPFGCASFPSSSLAASRFPSLTLILLSPCETATLTGLKRDCQHARTRLWDAHRHAGNLFCSLHSHRLRFDAWTAWARRLAANEVRPLLCPPSTPRCVPRIVVELTRSDPSRQALPDYGERPPSPPAGEHAPAYNELYPLGA